MFFREKVEMRKSLWWIFLLCSLIFSVVIYWQWTEFTVGSTYREINNIEQQIEIKQRADRLLISHTFYNVDGEDITVRYPKSATNFRCGNKQSRKCPQTLNIDHDNVNFRYEIQFDAHQNTSILQDWYVILEKMKTSLTTIHIAVDKEVSGTWITAAPLVYNEELDHVRYFSFVSEDEEHFPLIWHKKPLSYMNYDKKVSVYHDGEIDKDQLSFLKKFTNDSDKKYPIILLTDQMSPQWFPSLVITTKHEKKLEQAWTEQFLLTNFWNGDEEERWLFALLATYITNIKPTSELQPYIKELQENVSDIEKQQLINNILRTKGFITAEKMDDYLGKIKKMKTTFFKRCLSNLGKPEVMYFTLDKPIVLHGETVLNEPAIVWNHHLYFPFEPVVKQFGFNFTHISNHEYYLTNGVDMYRLYRNRDFFIFNEEKYGFFLDQSIDPIIVVDEKIYVTEKVFTDIFHFGVIHLSDQVYIY